MSANQKQEINNIIIRNNDKAGRSFEGILEVEKEIINFQVLSSDKIFTRNILKTILIRLCLIGHSLCIIYFSACVSQDNTYWFLIAPVFLIVLDTAYICIFRNGVEFDW